MINHLTANKRASAPPGRTDGRTPGRGPADRDQGGVEGGRSQGRDRRDPEQEAHGRTQATAMMMAHGGADGGRAMEERWPPTPGGQPMAVEQVVEEPEVETESQRARGMPRIRGARVEPRALVTEAEAEIRGGAGATEDQGGAGERKEPNGAGGTERRGAARGEESRGDGGSTLNQGGAGGMREPVELVDRWVTVEARELGADVEPLGLRTEAESGPRRLEAEVRETPTPATLEDGSHRIDGGLRASRGAAKRQRWRRIFEERALEGALEARSWLEPAETKEGWMGPAEMKERGEGGISITSSVLKSIKSPSMSSSPRCTISSPSAVVQEAELHSALTPSMAGSLVVGTVAALAPDLTG